MKKLIVLFFCLYLGACKQYTTIPIAETKDAIDNLPIVRTEKLSLTNAPIPIHSIGTIGIREVQNLSFKTGGIIEKIYVKATQKVQKGQLLATVSNTDIDGQAQKAQQVLDKATRELAVIQKMYADTAATLTQVENLKTNAEIAKANLKTAQSNQAYTKIIAPARGRILQRLAENNELIRPGIPILQLATNGQKGLVIKTNISDKAITKLQLNDKAIIRFDAYPKQDFKAYVSQIAEVADSNTGTYAIELNFENTNKLVFKSGFIGKITLYPSKQLPYYKIDLNALVEGYENKVNLFSLTTNGAKNIAKKISISPDYIGSNFFTTYEPKLEEDLLIITEGAAYLSDGMEVQVK